MEQGILNVVYFIILGDKTQQYDVLNLMIPEEILYTQTYH